MSEQMCPISFIKRDQILWPTTMDHEGCKEVFDNFAAIEWITTKVMKDHEVKCPNCMKNVTALTVGEKDCGGNMLKEYECVTKESRHLALIQRVRLTMIPLNTDKKPQKIVTIEQIKKWREEVHPVEQEERCCFDELAKNVKNMNGGYWAIPLGISAAFFLGVVAIWKSVSPTCTTQEENKKNA